MATDRPSLVKAREIVADMLLGDGDGTTGRILNQAWRDELAEKIAEASDAVERRAFEYAAHAADERGVTLDAIEFMWQQYREEQDGSHGDR